jgi:hypothetical protein
VLSHAIATLSVSDQWNSRTNGSQTLIIGRAGAVAVNSPPPRISELFERLRVVGHVGPLTLLVKRLDLVASAFDFDLSDQIALSFQLPLERLFGLPLRFGRDGAFTVC